MRAPAAYVQETSTSGWVIALTAPLVLPLATLNVKDILDFAEHKGRSSSDRHLVSRRL